MPARSVAMAPAGLLTFGTQPPSSIAPATNFGFTVQLRFRGDVLKLVSGVPVQVFISAGPGTLTGATTVATNASGLATFSSLQLSTAGSVTLRVQAPGHLPITSAVTVAASGAIIFDSDWSTATGTSDAAIRDTSKAKPWSATWGGSAGLTVVPTAGLGMPTGMINCLRIPVGNGDFGWTMAKHLWDTIEGAWVYFRMYLRLVFNSITGGYGGTHPFESEGDPTSISGGYHAMHFGSQTDGRSYWYWDTGGFGHQWTTPNWTGSNPGTLDQDTTYRLEWALRKNGVNHDVDMKITGPNDVDLLFDRSNLEWWGGDTMAVDGNNQPVDTDHANDARVGINGGFSASPLVFMYIGGFQVRSDQFPGAYSA